MLILIELVFKKFLNIQYHDHYDIIVYLLINKEFHFRRISDQLIPISFYLFGYNTYSFIFIGIYQISLFFFYSQNF